MTLDELTLALAASEQRCRDLDARMVENAKHHDELRRQWAARIEELESRRTFTGRDGVTYTVCTLQALEVLKAADAIPEKTLRGINPLSDFADLAKAEIARRKAAGEYDT